MIDDLTKIAQILVAAGKGARLGGELPKQYRDVAGEPLMRHTLKAFEASGVDIFRSVVVVAPDDDRVYSVIQGIKPLPRIVTGGATRTQSVMNGLASLANNPPDIVLIHDAARPFVTAKIIKDIVKALERSQAAVPILPLVDAIKRVDTRGITVDVDRRTIRRVQTPQGFRYKDIWSAYQKIGSTAGLSDDIAVAHREGFSIRTVDGDERNFKVTHPSDLEKAEQMFNEGRYVATGSGFDVHAFEPGDTLWLCGVEIKAGISLKGHSDADVGLHALTDAILGALADGDIGDHFPPSDPQWEGAASHKFVEFAAQKVKARGGRIEHVDVTLICEKPKVKPHRDVMRETIAVMLDLPLSRVSVKATTTEKLGFTGREEGIAAQAMATVSLKDA